MRILFATKSLEVEGGGAERVLTQVASGLADQGHEITVLTFDRPDAKTFYPLHPAIDTLNLGIGHAQRPARLLETARRMIAIRRSVCDLRPDVVVAFMHSMFIPAGIALVGSGIPVLASEHIVGIHYQERPLQSFLLRLTPLFVRSISIVSEQAKASYPGALRAMMTVLPNPVCVNPSQFADVVGAGRNRKTLLSVGRLEAQKDHATLIDAFAKIATKVTDWDLRIVGEGSLRGELEARVRDYGLEERVQLPGTIREIETEYIRAQLFALPSSYESFGLVTAEALAAGLPVVGFASCAGTNKLIEPGVNGVLVEEGRDRASALADALLPLMRSAEHRSNLKPSCTIPTEYSIDNILPQWNELLEVSTGKKRSPIAKDMLTSAAENQPPETRKRSQAIAAV